MTGLIARGYYSTHLDHKASVDEIQRVDLAAVRPGNVVVVVVVVVVVLDRLVVRPLNAL
jgi:hypothetical protein